MNQQLKALISVRAIPSHLFVTNFYFKGTQQFTGCFPNQDWLCHPWRLIPYKQKVAKADKANLGWENTL